MKVRIGDLRKVIREELMRQRVEEYFKNLTVEGIKIDPKDDRRRIMTLEFPKEPKQEKALIDLVKQMPSLMPGSQSYVDQALAWAKSGNFAGILDLIRTYMASKSRGRYVIEMPRGFEEPTYA
jgi:hypothetical protein